MSQGNYTGGYVKTPKQGIYKNVIELDFRSLYPSIILAHNIDPKTLNSKCNKKDRTYVPEFEKRYFCLTKKAKVPERLAKILEKRAKVKKMLKSKKLKKDERIKLEKKEKQYKLAANITYGYFGYPKSPWYNINCAESISAFGRYYIQEVIKKAEKEGFKVIYGDTDSIFVQGTVSKAKSFAKKINSLFPDPIDIEYRGIYKRGFFVSKKKRYALIDSKDNITIKGFETVRGDWCSIAKETQKKVIKKILQEKHNAAAKELRKAAIKIEKENAKISDVTLSVQLTKPISQYKAKAPHVEAAKKLIKSGKKVEVNSIIKYVITDRPGSISEKAEPVSSAKSYDKKYYIMNQILPSSLRILQYSGIFESDILIGSLSKYKK